MKTTSIKIRNNKSWPRSLRVFSLAVVLSIGYNLSAQNYEYANTFGGAFAFEEGRATATDANGNTYVTGTFFGGDVDFDPSPAPGDTAFLSSNGRDIFLAKYDANGAYVYAFGIGGALDGGHGIALDQSGNVYITGLFQGTIDFDPSANSALITANGTNTFLAKYDATGAYVYALSLGGNNNTASAVAVDASGNAYITGGFSGTTDFDPSGAIANLTPNGGSDIFLAKYSPSGAYISAINIGGTANDGGFSVAVDVNNNVYLAGSFRETADFDPSGSTLDLTSNGNLDAFLAKYDASGSLLYAFNIGGNGNDNASSVVADANGNAFITGDFRNSGVDFDPSASTNSLSSNGGTDVFLAKYDALGNYIYAINPGGNGTDFGASVAVDEYGNAFIAGGFTGNTDFDPSANTANLLAASGTDVFLAKYDSLGNYVNAFSFGGAGSGNDIGLDVSVDGIGNIYLTGSYQGTVDFDPSASSVSHTSNGSADVFLAKYRDTTFVSPPDTIKPNAITKDITVYLDANGEAIIAPSDIDNGSSDNDGIETYGISATDFGCNSAAFALAFDGTNDHVQMPNGIVNGLSDFTFETWVDYQDNGIWARLFDIGINSTVNMFLTPKNGRISNGSAKDYPRFSITTSGILGEQQINANVPMPEGWHHIAVTLAQNSSTGDVEGIMYIDGVEVGRNSNMSLTPSDLGVTTQNFLGKSQYSDPYFKNALDETRIWSVARSQAQIQASMNASLSGNEFGLFVYYDYEDGPGSATVNDKSPSNNDGTLVNMDVNAAFIPSNVLASLGVGVHPVVLTVIDSTGNVDSATSMVTVVDSISPTATTQNISVQLDGSGMATISGTDLVLTFDDNCGVATIGLSISTFDCSHLGANNVTVTVSDINGNSFVTNAIVIVSDTASVCAVADTALALVSDSTWRLSTVVGTATSNSYPWPGVNSLPAEATFTLPVVLEQPYGFLSIFSVPGSEVISSLSGVTFYRKTFDLVDPVGIEARFRMFVDDDMHIFINGHWIALEDGMGVVNFRTENHDLLFNGDGTYTNANMGGDPFDYVTGANLDTILKAGTNSLVVAIRNRTSKVDLGGFSFRMDLDKGAVKKSNAGNHQVSSSIAENQKLLIFPNPTSGNVTVLMNHSNQSKVEGTVTVFDFSGKQVISQSIYSETELNLNSLPAGVYLVKVTSGAETFTQKVVKQ